MAEAARRQMRLVMPEGLAQRLDRRSGGNRTRFILEALEERLQRLEVEELEAELAQGYQARAREHTEWASAVEGAVAETVRDA